MKVASGLFCCWSLLRNNTVATNPQRFTLYYGSSSGGFKVGGARGKTKKGAPLMSSSYSANRDWHF